MFKISGISGIKGSVNSAKYKTSKEGSIDLHGLSIFNENSDFQIQNKLDNKEKDY